MKKKHIHPTDVELLPPGNGWLLVEFGGETRDESDEKAARLMDRLKGKKDAPSMKLFDDEFEEEHLWKVRESGLGATARIPANPMHGKAGKIRPFHRSSWAAICATFATCSPSTNTPVALRPFRPGLRAHSNRL